MKQRTPEGGRGAESLWGAETRGADTLDGMLNLRSLVVFIAILVALNFVLSEVDYGVHISIVGSIVLTLAISFAMNMFSGPRE